MEHTDSKQYDGACVYVVVLKVHRLALKNVDRVIGDGLVRSMQRRRVVLTVHNSSSLERILLRMMVNTSNMMTSSVEICVSFAA